MAIEIIQYKPFCSSFQQQLLPRHIHSYSLQNRSLLQFRIIEIHGQLNLLKETGRKRETRDDHATDSHVNQLYSPVRHCK